MKSMFRICARHVHHSATPRRQDDDAIRRCSCWETPGWACPTPWQLLVSVRRLSQIFAGGTHLLQRTPDDEINRIKVRAIWRPHVWFSKLDVLALQVTQRVLRRVCWSAVLLQRPLVSAASSADVGQQTLCHYVVAVVLAVDLGTRLDEDDFCFAHSWHADRHHDTASFEIVIRVRQVAPLLHIINFNN